MSQSAEKWLDEQEPSGQKPTKEALRVPSRWTDLWMILVCIAACVLAAVVFCQALSRGLLGVGV